MRWTCGFNLKERKKNTELEQSLGSEPVSLAIRWGRLRWFGRVRVQHKDDADWVK